MKKTYSARICKAWMLLALCVLIVACGEDSGSTSSRASNEADGVLVDARDGQSYRIITIGTQTWMAQNLNYETADSYCYDDLASDCVKYGRLYTWAAAMDSAGIWSEGGLECGYGNTCTPNYPVRGVCPEGWHLPTRDEWVSLLTFDGDLLAYLSETDSYFVISVGSKFRASSGWRKDGNGTDDFGFSALPAGEWSATGQGFWRYSREGEMAIFWSSSEVFSEKIYGTSSSGFFSEQELCAHIFSLSGVSDNVSASNREDKAAGLSVRCLKDSE